MQSPKLSPLWKRTKDAYGHEPKFKVMCFRCGKEMPLRHSYISVEDEDEPISINQMSYKCKYCAWFITFNVKDDGKYLQKVMKKYRARDVGCPVCKGKGHFHTGDIDTGKIVDELNKVMGTKKLVPVEEWTNEDAEVKRQLEALGYYGGREEMA